MQDIPRVFKDYLGLMEEEMNRKNGGSSWMRNICADDTQYIVDKRFAESFRQLSHEEKVRYYTDTVNFAYSNS